MSGHNKENELLCSTLVSQDTEESSQEIKTNENVKARAINISTLFASLDKILEEEELRKRRSAACDLPKTAIDRHMVKTNNERVGMNGLKRIQLCRNALDALDRRGWDRSFHQRLFHEVCIPMEVSN